MMSNDAGSLSNIAASTTDSGGERDFDIENNRRRRQESREREDETKLLREERESNRRARLSSPWPSRRARDSLSPSPHISVTFNNSSNSNNHNSASGYNTNFADSLSPSASASTPLLLPSASASASTSTSDLPPPTHSQDANGPESLEEQGKEAAESESSPDGQRLQPMQQLESGQNLSSGKQRHAPSMVKNTGTGKRRSRGWILCIIALPVVGAAIVTGIVLATGLGGFGSSSLNGFVPARFVSVWVAHPTINTTVPMIVFQPHAWPHDGYQRRVQRCALRPMRRILLEDLAGPYITTREADEFYNSVQTTLTSLTQVCSGVLGLRENLSVACGSTESRINFVLNSALYDSTVHAVHKINNLTLLHRTNKEMTRLQAIAVARDYIVMFDSRITYVEELWTLNMHTPLINALMEIDRSMDLLKAWNNQYLDREARLRTKMRQHEHKHAFRICFTLTLSSCPIDSWAQECATIARLRKRYHIDYEALQATRCNLQAELKHIQTYAEAIRQLHDILVLLAGGLSEDVTAFQSGKASSSEPVWSSFFAPQLQLVGDDTLAEPTPQGKGIFHVWTQRLKSLYHREATRLLLSEAWSNYDGACGCDVQDLLQT